MLFRSELRFGEPFIAYDESGGWLWGQSGVDDYVGYARAEAFAPAPPTEPSHRVCVLATPLLPAPDVKHAPIDLLPMNARVRVLGDEGRFARLAEGFVFAPHLTPLTTFASDWVAIAENYVGVPYVWGGLTHDGLDCSGLVQNALAAAGIKAPRDSDMMERALGNAVALTNDFSNVTRGDLVFWKGHVGLMVDAQKLLHANGHHMQVTREPLAEAVMRIAKNDGTPVRTIKRL